MIKMSMMADDSVRTANEVASWAMKLLGELLKLMITAEQHRHERNMARIARGQSPLVNKIAGAAAAGISSGIDKLRMGSGEIDLEKFAKLCKSGKHFESVEIATKVIPEITELAKKAKIPIFCCDRGGNMTSVAIPADSIEAFNKITTMVMDKVCSRDPNSYEIIETKGLKSDIHRDILHDLTASYDIPTISFNGKDGNIISAVPKEYAEQFRNIQAEAKEMYTEVSDVEIADFTEEFPWDDISTMAIEVTPRQAKLLKEQYKSEIKLVDIGDGKIYAYGNKDMSESVTEVINNDKQNELAARDWDIAVIDNTILMNKSLITAESDSICTMRIPGTDSHINFEKSELTEIDGGKTYRSKIDYSKEYDICSADGTSVGKMSGEELAMHYNTRSPFFKMLNESTDKTRYNDKSIDRIELFNPKENRLVSFPIRQSEELKQDMCRIGISEAVADKIIEKIEQKLPSDYAKEFGSVEYTPDTYKSAAISNKVKQTLFAQKTADAVCTNEQSGLGDKFGIFDKSKKQYVLIDKNSSRENIESALKTMGYLPIERASVISQLAKQYNLEGELLHTSEKAESIITNNPDLKGVAFTDLGNDRTAIFNADLNNEKVKYIVVDKYTNTVEFEKMAGVNLGITDASSVAELTQQFKDKIAAPKIIAEGKDVRTDGQDYTISQLTTKFMEIRQESTGKSVLMNKDNIDTNKLAASLNIKPESAKKLAAVVEKSFKVKDESQKTSSLNKLKKYAEKVFEQKRTKEIDATGKEKSVSLSNSERSR